MVVIAYFSCHIDSNKPLTSLVCRSSKHIFPTGQKSSNLLYFYVNENNVKLNWFNLYSNIAIKEINLVFFIYTISRWILAYGKKYASVLPSLWLVCFSNSDKHWRLCDWKILGGGTKTRKKRWNILLPYSYKYNSTKTIGLHLLQTT